MNFVVVLKGILITWHTIKILFGYHRLSSGVGISSLFKPLQAYTASRLEWEKLLLVFQGHGPVPCIFISVDLLLSHKELFLHGGGHLFLRWSPISFPWHVLDYDCDYQFFY